MQVTSGAGVETFQTPRLGYCCRGLKTTNPLEVFTTARGVFLFAPVGDKWENQLNQKGITHLLLVPHTERQKSSPR